MSRLVAADKDLELVGMAGDLPELVGMAEAHQLELRQAGLSEEQDVNRRVKAVLLFLGQGRGG